MDMNVEEIIRDTTIEYLNELNDIQAKYKYIYDIGSVISKLIGMINDAKDYGDLIIVEEGMKELRQMIVELNEIEKEVANAEEQGEDTSQDGYTLNEYHDEGPELGGFNQPLA